MPKLQDCTESPIFQQDGAPPHYFRKVVSYLNRKYPGKWIGRGGPIKWPSRSPDLTPCDFFLWGYIKDQVYKTPVQDIVQLKRRITRACNSISQETLQKVFRNLNYRLSDVINKNGAQIEIR